MDVKKYLIPAGLLILGFLAGMLVNGGAPDHRKSEASGERASASSGEGAPASAQNAARDGRSKSADRDSKKQTDDARLAERYRRLAAMLEKQNAALPGLNFNENLSPSDSLGDFFNLTKEDKERLGKIGQESLAKIRQREQERMKVVKSDESGVSYEIPADSEFAETVKRDFEQGVQEVVGKEGSGLLSKGIDNLFANMNSKRVVSSTTTDDKASFKIENFDDGGRSVSSTVYSQDGVNDQNPPRIPDRYKHLFKSTGDK